VTENVQSKLEFDVADALGVSDEFFKKMGDGVVSVNAGWELLDKAIGAVVATIEGAASAALDIAKASDEQERANRRLLTTAQLQGQATAGLVENANEFASILQQLTGIEDDVTLSIQAQLTAMGTYRGDLDKATLAVVGFSEAHGVPLQSAVRLVGRMIEGDTTAFKKYGVEVDSASEAIDRYAGLSSIAIENGDDLSGKLDVLAANWGDLGEAVGAFVSNSDTVNDLALLMAEGVYELSTTISENGEDIEEFFGEVKKVADDTAHVLAALSAAVLGFHGVAATIATDTGQIAEALRGEDDPATDIPFRLRMLEQRYQREEELRRRAEQRIETANRIAAERERKERQRLADEWEKDLEAFFEDRAKKRKQIAQREIEAEIDLAAHKREIEIEELKLTNEIRFQLQMDAFEAEQAAKRAHLDQNFAREQKAFEKRIDALTNYTARYLDIEKVKEQEFSQTTLAAMNSVFAAVGALEDGVSQSIGTIVSGLVKGEEDIGNKIGAIFGATLDKVGDTLIGLSIAALATNLLSLIPVLAPLAGPPGVSSAAAALLGAAGIAVKGIAAALGAATSGTSSGAGGSGSAAPSRSVSIDRDGGRGQSNYTDILPEGSSVGDEHRERAAREAHRERQRSRAREAYQKEREGGSGSSFGGGYDGGGGGGAEKIVNHYHVSMRGAFVGDRGAREIRKMGQRADRLRGRRG
jgi:hypothetical protein